MVRDQAKTHRLLAVLAVIVAVAWLLAFFHFTLWPPRV